MTGTVLVENVRVYLFLAFIAKNEKKKHQVKKFKMIYGLSNQFLEAIEANLKITSRVEFHPSPLGPLLILG